jgi:hypothetical protein
MVIVLADKQLREPVGAFDSGSEFAVLMLEFGGFARPLGDNQ